MTYKLYQAYSNYKSVNALNTTRSVNLKSLRTANHTILHSSKGQQGEDAVHAAVKQICSDLNISYVTNRELKLPNAILLPQGPDVYSKEIDLVVLSEIGVFEAKNWQGEWSSDSEDHRQLQCIRSQGNTDKRPAPLYKTQRKLEHLLQISKADTDIFTEAVVVFTNPQSRLDPKLPTNYLHISELAYYFRTKLAEAQGRGERWSVQELTSRFWACFDRSPNALHDHMMRLSESSESIKAYHANHQRIVTLEQQPVLTFQMDSKIKFMSIHVTVYSFLTFFFGILI